METLQKFKNIKNQNIKMKEKIWLSSPHMGGNEQDFVNEAFATVGGSLGPNVNGFEQDLENYLGNNAKVAALASGTSALHLALIMAGVSHGDEVLCQKYDLFCVS